MRAAQRSLSGYARKTLCAFGLPSTKQDVEDVLSDAYLSAATTMRNQPDMQVENERAWFRTIVRRTCLKRVARDRRDGHVVGREDETLDVIDRSGQSVELTIAVEEALGRFPERDQQIVKLASAGHTSEEMSAYFGDMTAVAIRQRKSRVLATLKEMLGGASSWLK